MVYRLTNCEKKNRRERREKKEKNFFTQTRATAVINPKNGNSK